MLMRPKVGFPELFFGVLLAVAIFAIGILFSLSYRPNDSRYQNDGTRGNSNNLAEERVADYTYALDVLTFLLIASTIGLGVVGYIGIRNQSKDTRIIQRAYLNVEPRGIELYTSDDSTLSCDVVFLNAGNLPASKVNWYMCRRFSRNPKANKFPVPDIKDLPPGENLIPPRAQIRKGAPNIKWRAFQKFRSGSREKDDCWLYVWGRVRYNDGFQDGRWVDFCHRYNLRGTTKSSIDREDGRQHEYGNQTDEG